MELHWILDALRVLGVKFPGLWLELHEFILFCIRKGEQNNFLFRYVTGMKILI